MKAVVHARGQAQRDVDPVAETLDHLGVAQQLLQLVREALGLYHLRSFDRAAGTDDAVGRADGDIRIAVDSARALLEFTRETVMHALEMGLAGLAQVEVGQVFPDGYRNRAHQWLLDLAEPADELRQRAARKAVGDQEIQIFLAKKLMDGGANRHICCYGHTRLKLVHEERSFEC